MSAAPCCVRSKAKPVRRVIRTGHSGWRSENGQCADPEPSGLVLLSGQGPSGICFPLRIGDGSGPWRAQPHATDGVGTIDPLAKALHGACGGGGIIDPIATQIATGPPRISPAELGQRGPGLCEMFDEMGLIVPMGDEVGLLFRFSKPPPSATRPPLQRGKS